METKNSIRKRILSLRNAMSAEEQVKKSEEICNRAFALDAVQNAEIILNYAGYQSEVLTDLLTQKLLMQKKQVYFPKVIGEDMEFYRVTHLSDLVKGYKNIPEPGIMCNDTFTLQKFREYEDKVVIIMPGCAFSNKGERIGYGKGFYDRYLSKFSCKKRIAFCFELQLVDEICTDYYDIPVTQIITEQRKIPIKHFDC